VIEQWVRQEVRPGQDFASKWQNRRAIAFLVALQEDKQVGAENLLEEYRKAGLYPKLGRYLLQFGKEQEALDTARERLTEPMEVIRFAEQLLPVSEVWRAAAFTFVETRLKEASQLVFEHDNQRDNRRHEHGISHKTEKNNQSHLWVWR
jgi:hypothetical protein